MHADRVCSQVNVHAFSPFSSQLGLAVVLRGTSNLKIVGGRIKQRTDHACTRDQMKIDTADASANHQSFYMTILYILHDVRTRGLSTYSDCHASTLRAPRNEAMRCSLVTAANSPRIGDPFRYSVSATTA